MNLEFNRSLQTLTVLVMLCGFCFKTNAQILTPAKWRIEMPKKTVRVGDNVTIFFKVILTDSWYIYSSDQDPDLGPIPTSFEFEEDGSYRVIGKPIPIKMKEKYDDVWEGTVRVISTSGGGFKIKIKVLQSNPTVVGNIIYTTCSMKTGQCIFPEEDFEFDIKTAN
ncbi:hypothetical protein [uncultured Polaribacter sp.]|uniref:hypothetical protein n=1 Tax=uncultured Polaribacter sp. TaxID=174711 RepID=UPI00261AB070|nr:hypothetical protein [uncultured Polaribacter sp.]